MVLQEDDDMATTEIKKRRREGGEQGAPARGKRRQGIEGVGAEAAREPASDVILSTDE